MNLEAKIEEQEKVINPDEMDILYRENEKVDLQKLENTWGFTLLDHGSMSGGKSRWQDANGNIVILTEDNKVDQYRKNDFCKGEIIPVQEDDLFSGEKTLKKWHLVEDESYSDQGGHKMFTTSDGLAKIKINPNNGEVLEVVNLRGY